MPPLTIIAIIIGAALPVLAVAIIGFLTLRRTLQERRGGATRGAAHGDPAAGSIAGAAVLATSPGHCDGGSGASAGSDGGGAAC